MKKPEPLVLLAIIFGVLGVGGLAILFNVTNTPINSVAKLGAVFVPLVVTLISAFFGRGQVVPNATAEAAVSKALTMDPPASQDVADGMAKKIVTETK